MRCRWRSWTALMAAAVLSGLAEPGGGVLERMVLAAGCNSIVYLQQRPALLTAALCFLPSHLLSWRCLHSAH